MVQAFASNPDVAFGDVNLSEEPIRDAHHSPGAGGWPTIRYFNKETGIKGASYVKKTSDAMCTELGNDDYMRAYVQEAGGTSLCSATTGAGCSEKELGYIEKMKSKPADEIVAQLQRLTNMKGGSMKPDLVAWINARIAILKQLGPKDDTSHDEDF